MTEHDTASPTPMDSMPHAHIVGFVSRAISTDGTSAMLVFETGGDTPESPTKRFALTLPTAQLGWLRSIIHDLAVEADRKTGPAGAYFMHVPEEMSVGNSPEMRGHTVITWDAKRPTEAHYLLLNLDALKLRDMLRADIMPRLTLEERQQMRLLQPQRGIVGPDGRPVS